MPPSTRRSARGVGQVGVHGVDQVGDLEGDPFEGGAGEVGDGGRAGQAEDRAAGLGLPVGGAQAGQGGDEQDARVRVGVEAEAVDLGGGADGLQAVAEPLHGRPRDEDAPLQGVLRRAVAQGGRQGRDQPPRRGDDRSRRCGPAGRPRCRRCTWPGPAARHPWPTSDACWSPATPAIGRPSGR